MSDAPDLSALKLEEEIASIRAERNAARMRLRLDIARSVVMLFGAFILFWAIQRPDSILSRAASKEAIARERARLILEWTKEPDASRRKLALTLIRATYGAGDDAWVRRAEDALAQQANADAITQSLAQIAALSLRGDSLREASRWEAAGRGPSGTEGMGPVAYALHLQAAHIDAQISALKLSLIRAGYDTTRISYDTAQLSVGRRSP